MPPTNSTSLDRAAALAVLASLFGGVGALGWLLGHMVTYDVTGRHHDHATHGYMQPLQQGSVTVAMVGVALAVLAVSIGRHAVARWVDRWRRSGSLVPWLVAATIPAATFVGVEALEGSISARAVDLVALGVPLQALIGVVVLAVVRSLLTVLVRVAGRIAGSRPARTSRAPRRVARPGLLVHSLRVAPMATNAALRAPPRIAP